MQKVVDYTLVRGATPELLIQAVKSAMAENWVPSGIVVHFKNDLIQAMVKFEDA